MHLQLLLLSGSGTRWIQLLVALSILILLHEGGHYFFAKLFKTRVEKFYLFFDFLFPFGGLLNFSLFKKKIGDTEYGIGWFPLGGYVKIAGMVDESMDKEQLAKPPEPWEYRSKPAWQRLFIMLGGIIMNLLVAMVVYTVIYSVWPEHILQAKNLKYGISTDSLGRSIGLRDGDKILAVDGQPATRFRKISKDILLNNAKTLQIERAGNPVTVNLPHDLIGQIIKSRSKNSAAGGLIEPRVPAVIGDIEEKSEAGKMKLQKGDSIIMINGQPVQFYDEVREKISLLKNAPIQIIVYRGKQLGTFNGRIDSTSTLGIYGPPLEKYLSIDTIRYNPVQAVGKGFSVTFEQIGDYFKQLKIPFSNKGVKPQDALGGFGSFSKLFSTEFDLQEFLGMLAFISVILAIMNLLPIPGLDGGYVIFTLWEMVTGKKVSDKVMEVATTVGLVLLLALMLYANGLDIFRYFKK